MEVHLNSVQINVLQAFTALALAAPDGIWELNAQHVCWLKMALCVG